MNERKVVVTFDGTISNYFTTNLDLDEVVEFYETINPFAEIKAYEEFSVPLDIARRHMTDEQYVNYQQNYIKA